MGDPFRMFADASDAKQGTLKAIWPELYEVLARLDRPAQDVTVRCAVYRAHEIGTYAQAAGRLLPDGPPACTECMAAAGVTPNGYPLKRGET